MTPLTGINCTKSLLILNSHLVCKAPIIWSEKVGLKINEDKTKYMLVHRSIKPTDDFLNVMYLGAVVTSNNEENTEIDGRILMGNRCLGGFNKLIST